LLQTTDKLIKSVPEVASVFGKTGKAETATDSAPLEMVETTIRRCRERLAPGFNDYEKASFCKFAPSLLRGVAGRHQADASG
ncbi:hypothetical protein DD576_20260, partial [Klebsiella pneumoniae]